LGSEAKSFAPQVFVLEILMQIVVIREKRGAEKDLSVNSLHLWAQLK
jgi:hypothetical protein